MSPGIKLNTLYYACLIKPNGFASPCGSLPWLRPVQTQDVLQMRSVLPAGDSRSRDTLLRQQPSGKAQQSQQQQQQPRQAAKAVQLPVCPRPPMDWSLKRRALFHSQTPFSVARDAIMAPSAAGATSFWLRVFMKPPQETHSSM